MLQRGSANEGALGLGALPQSWRVGLIAAKPDAAVLFPKCAFFVSAIVFEKAPERYQQPLQVAAGQVWD